MSQIVTENNIDNANEVSEEDIDIVWEIPPKSKPRGLSHYIQTFVFSYSTLQEILDKISVLSKRIRHTLTNTKLIDQILNLKLLLNRHNNIKFIKNIDKLQYTLKFVNKIDMAIAYQKQDLEIISNVFKYANQHAVQNGKHQICSDTFGDRNGFRNFIKLIQENNG